MPPDLGQAPSGPPEEGDEITLEPLRPRTFDKTSPVTAYWLRRCDGFQVVGGRRPAVVEGAVYDDDPLHPVGLRVWVGNKSRRLIPIDAVEAVCPLGRTLYVRRPPTVAARAGVGLVALGAGTQRTARASAFASAAVWRFAAPRAAVGARATFAAARSAFSAARAQWPSVRRGAVFAAEAAFFFSLALAQLVASGAIVVARLLRAGFHAARRYAPRGARLAGESVTAARRAGFTFARRALR